MGTFRSHIAAGIFFGIIGLWNSFLCAFRFAVLSSCKRNKMLKLEQINNNPKKCKLLPTRYKLYWAEILLKMFFYIILIFLEKWTIPLESLVHVTLLLGLCMGSLIEMLICFGILGGFPEKFDMFISNCLGFGVLGFLLYSHDHLGQILEAFMHKLYLIAVVGYVFFSFLEIAYSKEVLFSYGRSAAILLQSTWAIQLAYIIYGDKKDEWLSGSSHEHGVNHDQNVHNSTYLTIYFCWHIFAIVFFLIIQLYIVIKLYASSLFAKKLIDRLVLIDNKKIETNEYFQMMFYGEEEVREELLNSE
jgi:hypothetical protein